MNVRNKLFLSLLLIFVFSFEPVNSTFIQTSELLYSPDLSLGSYIWQVDNFTIALTSNITTSYDSAQNLANISLNQTYGNAVFQLSNTSKVTVQILQSVANKSLGAMNINNYLNLTVSKGSISINNVGVLIEGEYENFVNDYSNGTTIVTKSYNYFDWLNQSIYTSGLTMYDNYSTRSIGNLFVIEINNGNYNQTSYYEKNTGLLERLSMTDPHENITLSLTSTPSSSSSTMSPSSSSSTTSTTTSVSSKQTSSTSKSTTKTTGVDFVSLAVGGLLAVVCIRKIRKKV